MGFRPWEKRICSLVSLRLYPALKPLRDAIDAALKDKLPPDVRDFQ
jgi:hypothetical protein